jgi:hypothetical protein
MTVNADDNQRLGQVRDRWNDRHEISCGSTSNVRFGVDAATDAAALLEIINAREVAASVPRLPTVCEIRAALSGRVPELHPARTILLGAVMLATVRDWVTPDVVVLGSENYDGDDNFRCNDTDPDYFGSEVLAELGIADVCTLVRTMLIDRIDDAAGSVYQEVVGLAIDAIAAAHWEWRRAIAANTGHPDTDLGIALWVTRARRRVVAAQREYRMLAAGLTWPQGPDREPRDLGLLL